jgi:MFS family permease
VQEAIVQDAVRRRAMAGFAALGVWWGAWGAVLPAVQRSAGVDDAELGAALLCVGVGALAAMRVTGGLLDRFGRPVVTAAVAALALTGLGPGVVRGMGALAIALLLVGAASGALDVVINAEASGVEQVTGRPLLNLAHAAFSFSVILGSLGAGGLRAGGASAGTTLAAAGLAVAALGAWSLRGHELPAAPVMPAVDWRWFRPPGALARLGVLLALAFFVESVWQTWSAVHLERDLGANAGLAALGPALFGAAAGAGRLLGHRLVHRGNERILIASGAALAAVGSLAAAGLPTIPGVLAGIAAAGLGTATCAPSLLGLAGRWGGTARRGAAVGTATTLGYLGFVLAPAVIGGLAAATTLPIALGSAAVVAVALAAGTRWETPQDAGRRRCAPPSSKIR